MNEFFRGNPIQPFRGLANVVMLAQVATFLMMAVATMTLCLAYF